METLQERILHFLSKGDNHRKWFSSKAIQEGIHHDRKVTQPLFMLFDRGILHRLSPPDVTDIENIVGKGRYVYKIHTNYILPDELRGTTEARTEEEVQQELDESTPTSVSVACEAVDPTLQTIEELEREQREGQKELDRLKVECATITERVDHLRAIKKLLEEVISARQEIERSKRYNETLRQTQEDLESKVSTGKRLLQEAPPLSSGTQNQRPSIIGGKTKGVRLNVS